MDAPRPTEPHDVEASGAEELETAGSSVTSAAVLGLPEAVEANYRGLASLEALPAEVGSPLVRGIDRSTGQTAIIAVLDPMASSDDRARIYDRSTQGWPEHYGVPRVTDAASPDTPEPFVVWDVETGESLRSLLERGQVIPQRRALEIGRAVAETLAELHRFGKQAQHLAPALIWLGPAGICQVLGLGLGPPNRELDGEGQRYRAPEQLRSASSSMAERILARDLAERADVWSLGVILLELLEGRGRLSSRSADELALEQAQVQWRPPSHIGHELGSLLSRMLVLDPVYRDITLEEIASRLDDQLIDHQVTAPRNQTRSRGTPPPNDSAHPPADPPLPIPARTEQPTDWRQAVRSVQERRRAFEQEDKTSAWKLWLMPGVGLALVLLLLWLLMTLRPPA